MKVCRKLTIDDLITAYAVGDNPLEVEYVNGKLIVKNAVIEIAEEKVVVFK